ncbi:MAG TPA: TRAP transporter substrate-binding protein [Xanthomonadaceae bacterium]|nr:TRAP transporter substrate-binding protein [Xanthomonadaceae bacterium]
MSDQTFNLSRRALLKNTALLGAAVAIVGAPAIVGAAAPIRLTLGHGASPGNPRAVAADKFAQLVNERSGGAINVTVAGAAQLGDDAAMLTSLRTGALAISANSQGTTSGIVPELGALGLPFLFTDGATPIKLLQGKIGDQLRPKFEALGLVPLGWWENGVRHVTNSKREIKVPDDLKGLKIRTPPDPMTIDIFQALGAATAQIAFAELYVALQQGVVDGQENPLTNIASNKLYEVNKYISLTGHKWESNPVLMSKMAWGRLDAKLQTILMEAMAEATTLQVGLVQADSEKLLKEFRANPNVVVNEVDLAAFRQRTASVYEKWEQKPFGSFVKELRKTVGV